MNQAKHILVTAPLGVGGITSMMINIQKNIDREKINFDYLVLHDRHEDLEDVVIKMGSQKLIASADEISNKWHRGFVRWYRLYRVFKDNDIKVLHLNGGPASDMTTVFIAKLAGVKHVTFHSHNAGNAVYRNKISVAMSKIFKLFMPIFVDEFWACSSLAAQFSFPKSIVKNQKYKFIPNGVALEKFSYNVSLRKEMRKKLGVEDKFVIGHAGRFNNTKNQAFLLEVFKEFVKVKTNAILLLVGTGPDFEKIKELVSIHPNKDKIILYGESSDMSGLYSAMDIFVFPSKYEGLGLVAVEAQISGLPCVVSDVVPKEIVVGNNVTFISLKESASSWANTILNLSTSTEKRKDFYNSNQSLILRYDMNSCGRILDNCYQQIMGK